MFSAIAVAEVISEFFGGRKTRICLLYWKGDGKLAVFQSLALKVLFASAMDVPTKVAETRVTCSKLFQSLSIASASSNGFNSRLRAVAPVTLVLRLSSST